MVTTSKSVNLTARDTKPFTVVPARTKGAVVKFSGDTIENPNTSAADIAIFDLGLTVDDILVGLHAASDDAGATGTFDIGFYKRNNDGTFTVVEVDVIGNDIDNSGAAIALTNYRFSALNITTVSAPIWSLAGLTARPAYSEIFIGLTFDGNDSQIASITLQALYT